MMTTNTPVELLSATLSGRILEFISRLPQFTHLYHNCRATTRKTDGTQYHLPTNLSDRESGFIAVRWQGDAKRTSLLDGSDLACLAIIDAVDYWVAVGEFAAKERDWRISDMFRHFEVKTGCDDLYRPSSMEKHSSYGEFLKDLQANILSNIVVDAGKSLLS